MSPTIFRSGSFRFYFFSREERRAHVHVESADGEAKFWMEPKIELARSYKMKDKDIRRIRKLIEERENEIRNAWDEHFSG